MNKRPLLFVPIETKVREFHGKLLFSLAAIEKGFDVIIAGQQALKRELHLFSRGVYLDKSVAITRKKWFRRCRAMGNRITSWDEEGLVYFDGSSYLELRADKEAFDQTELFLAWGQDLKETLLQKFPDAEHKIECCGNPRFDLLRSELREFFSAKVETITRSHGKRIILINTNFGFCNHFRGVAASRKTLQTYPIAQSRPGFFDGWIDAQQIMFDQFKEFIPRLSRDFPDCKIIVRPHPSEDKNTWEDCISALPNVEVHSDGNVVEWILASKVLVHFNCTTAIESFLMDIPAIAYKTCDIGDYEQKLPNALSIEANDYEQLSRMVAGFVSGEEQFVKTDSQQAVALRFITGIDGDLAADRLAKAIRTVGFDGRPLRTPQQKIYTLWRSFWLLGKKIKDGGNSIDHYDLQKFPGLSRDEIEAEIERFKKITGRFQGIRVNQVTANCFSLTRA